MWRHPPETIAEDPSGLQSRPMEASETSTQALLSRPKRADARRNYEKVLTAARDAFAEGGEATSLEEIARRAGVGIGTLYRNFPNRQALVEAVYVNEVEEVCRSAAEFEGADDADAWEALNGWLERLIAYLATKRALAAELLNYLEKDAQLFQESRAALFAAGEPLLKRAQEAGAVRPDVEFSEVMHMVIGIGKIPAADPAQTDRILRVALDGLRYHPQS
jgi:AcrR family transcriptional regulator